MCSPLWASWFPADVDGVGIKFKITWQAAGTARATGCSRTRQAGSMRCCSNASSISDLVLHCYAGPQLIASCRRACLGGPQTGTAADHEVVSGVRGFGGTRTGTRWKDGGRATLPVWKELVMRALQFTDYGGPEVLTWADAPVPHSGPGQIRIAVRAASVNPIDCKRLAGSMSGGQPLTGPQYLGNDAAAVVDEVGEGVTGVPTGMMWPRPANSGRVRRAERLGGQAAVHRLGGCRRGRRGR